MHFEPRKINKSILDYVRDGILHLMKHSMLYVPTLMLCTLVTFGSSYLPSILRNIVNLYFGIFVMVWVMELTFSSKQEKYNFKKYLTSFLVSIVGWKKLIFDLILKTSAKYALLLLSLFCFIPNNINEANQTVFSHFAFLSNISIFMNIVVFSVWCKFIITDPLVMSRMTGQLNNAEGIDIAIRASKINKDIVFKMLFLCLFLVFTTILPLSNIIQFVVAISLTLYSMDVYQLNKLVKENSEQEERQEEILFDKA